MHLEIKPRAQRQLRAAYRWWRKHRDKAPDALEEDFAEALVRIAEAPHTGKFVKHQRDGVVRRYLMERVPYYLFYRAKSRSARERDRTAGKKSAKRSTAYTR